ncbi:MAG: YggS family pyridoxal phosphate-dependent enzyme [Deltaproteobacteria bacterium]|nr:YggS family pyridoxal phosphate-dependent enzyme [Deltaproteobacteria bacterium]
MNQIAQNLEAVKRRITAAARRAGRGPEQVRLVAVSKTMPVERLQEAVAAGQHLFGENYLQEARGKIEALGEAATWHFIGHLQSNKAKAAVKLFELIHGVDRLKLAEALDRAAAAKEISQKILIQVNLAKEASKSGTSLEAAADLLRQISQLPHLRVMGLMTMPPFLEPEAVRPYFRSLRELRDRLQDLQGNPLPELSMGMSGDFEVAIEEGATLVRVGTAIFGSRV